jgi:hypothetical protein
MRACCWPALTCSAALRTISRPCASPPAAGAYADFVRGSGARLCALGADGDALAAAGLPADVLPAEVSGRAAQRSAAPRRAAAERQLLAAHAQGRQGR